MSDLDLAALQTGLRGLIKRDGAPPRAPYLRLVEQSEELQIVRDIVLWWRLYGLGTTAPFTTALLRQRGTLETRISAFLARRVLSPFYEAQLQEFLDFIATGDDLERAVASYELALYRVQCGDPREYTVEWFQDPAEVLTAVVAGRPPESCRSGRYRTIVSSVIPNKFRIERAA